MHAKHIRRRREQVFLFLDLSSGRPLRKIKAQALRHMELFRGCRNRPLHLPPPHLSPTIPVDSSGDSRYKLGEFTRGLTLIHLIRVSLLFLEEWGIAGSRCRFPPLRYRPRVSNRL
jgi:hypothetical protein